MMDVFSEYIKTDKDAMRKEKY